MEAKILIIDDEVAIGRSIGAMLESEGFSAFTEHDAAGGIARALELRPEIVICDIRLPDQDGIEVLRAVREGSPKSMVIMITAYATVETAIEALKLGAADYMIKPILFDALLHRIRHLLEHRRLQWESQTLRHTLLDRSQESALVGSSPAMQKIRETIVKVAPTNSTVLVTGESGTGKELVAREIHRHSAVCDGPFLAVNCAAVPESLMESEFFGYRKGAFSGADQDRDGMLVLADGGTLFLDEIGDMPLPLQPKLLRAIESKEFMPLGAKKAVHVETRIIAASNRPLKSMVDEGSFRADLFHRLSLIRIEIPPLREHLEDIGDLVGHLIARLGLELGRPGAGIESAALAAMSQASWPGNVRELENRLRRALLLGEHDQLTADDLWGEEEESPSSPPSLRDAVHSYERRRIREALALHGGDKYAAAAELDISVSTLYAKLKDD